MFGRKEPKTLMTLEQCLAAIVVRNPQVQARDLEAGRIEISLPYMKPWLIRLFSRKEKTFQRKFELDEIGAELWRLIDGKHTTTELAEHLQRHRGLEPKQATESIVAYLQMLLVRGIVGLVVPGHERDEPRAQ